MTHIIQCFNPFTVLFHCELTGQQAVVKYQTVLTEAEIRAEYPYVEFPVQPLITFQVWHNCTETRFTDTLEAERVLVGVVQAIDLNNAFYRSQNDFSEDYRRLQVRSTSVGDVLVNTRTGIMYMVQSFGFKEVAKVLPAKEATN